MSGLTSTEFTIDGKKYKTVALDAFRNRGLYLRLVKAVMPAIERLSIAELKGPEKEEAFLKLLGSVIENFPEVLFEDLCNAFAGVTTLEEPGKSIPLGDPGVFGLHFSRRYRQMIEWVVQCCKANNYLDFLPGT